VKYQEFRKSIKRPIFSYLDIWTQRLPVFQYQLSSWKKKGYISSLKRGLYFFCDKKEIIRSEEVAFFLYEPSYISLESALSFYGIIPEIVYATTSISTRVTRKFSNNFGEFIYRQIKPALFFGYIPFETIAGKYLLAEPEKAFLDYIYFNLGRLNLEGDIAELRLNQEGINTLDQKKIKQYLKEFNIKKMYRIVETLIK
jgi:predicted transcriptional regulator of viral defense system